MRLGLLAVLLLASATAFAGTVPTASALLESCEAQGLDAKGKYNNKNPDAIYKMGQCEGFIEGWLTGIDGAILQQGDKLFTVVVKRSEIKSYWDVATALQKHLAAHPLDKGKSADGVLQSVMVDADLFTVTRYLPAGTMNAVDSK